MGLGDFLKTIGGVVAAPLTGGASLIPAIAGAATVAGDVIGNTAGARTSTSAPVISPEFQPLATLLRNRATQRLQSGFDTAPLASTGISDINNVYSGIKQSIGNDLTARGLSTSPIAGTVGANVDLARAANITNFLNTLPMMQRQMQNQDLALAGNVLGEFGTGRTATGAGSALGAGLGSAGEVLAYLNGLGAFQNPQTSLPNIRAGGVPTIPLSATGGFPLPIINF